MAADATSRGGPSPAGGGAGLETDTARVGAAAAATKQTRFRRHFQHIGIGDIAYCGNIDTAVYHPRRFGDMLVSFHACTWPVTLLRTMRNALLYILWCVRGNPDLSG